MQYAFPIFSVHVVHAVLDTAEIRYLVVSSTNLLKTEIMNQAAANTTAVRPAG